MKKSNLFLCVIIVIICSCSKQDVGSFQKLENKRDIPKISIDEAKQVLEIFFQSHDQLTTKGLSSYSIKKIKEHIYDIGGYSKTKASDIITDAFPIYEFILEENHQEGFALVLGDHRMPTVFAYSSYGSLNDTLENEALKLYLNSLPYMIKGQLDQQNLASVSAENERVLHLLPVRWGQEYPYNGKVEVLCNNLDAKYKGRAPAGCVAVAVAQVMAFHGKGPYRWDYLLSSSKITENSPQHHQDEIAKLMYDIGMAVNMRYSCSGSGSYLRDVVNILPLFGFYGYRYVGLSWQEIIFGMETGPMLMNGYPSTGSGHAWVIEGYETYSNIKRLYFSWGWSGKNDGWYYYNESSPEFNPWSTNHFFIRDMNVIGRIQFG